MVAILYDTCHTAHMSETTYKKKLSLTGVAAQIVTIGLLFVFWRLGQKWVVIPAALILIFLLYFLPKVITRVEAKFHKKALMLLSTGKASEVPAYASRQLLLSLFGASAPIDAKLGLAYAQIGFYEGALECLNHAIPYAPAIELPALQAAYVKSLFVTGDPARAEAEGRQMLQKGSARIPEVLVIIARARISQGKMGPETMAFIDEAEKLSTDGDVLMMIRLTRIELQLIHGKKSDELPGDADSSQPFLRVWIQLVRGKLREKRGNPGDALKAYAKAIKFGKDDRCWFAELARGRLESLSKGIVPEDNDTNSQLDDAVRRKKKRRR